MAATDIYQQIAKPSTIRVLTTSSTENHQVHDEKSMSTSIRVEEVEQSSSDESPKVWQCGEPYRFPLPAPEGDSWQTLLTPILEKDKAQCEAWKDEVQNLLIFAGLFSAVVTAFIIETYKGLQPDPSDTMINLLSRIAHNLENTSVSSTESLPPFSPAPWTVRVNIFFFISLILSLATVLIGIVSLQWLREHQAYTGSFTTQNTFAAVHMRSEALERWRVPEIFSALPLILQSALVLFFVGLIDFLLNIDVRVLIPVALVMGLILIFLLLTTTLPTFQAFILHHPTLKLNDEVPAPCPYKSPQSRAFRRLITSSRVVFLATSLTFATIYWMFMRLYLFPGQILNSSFYQSIQLCLTNVFDRLSNIDLLSSDKWFSKSQDGFGYMSHNIFEYWRVKSSFHFDLVWLTIRDNYFQSTCSPDSWLYSHRVDRQDQGATYDAILGLCKELKKDDANMNADFESPIFTAYCCALDPSTINQIHDDGKVNEAWTRATYLTALLGDNQSTSLSPFLNVVRNPSLPLLCEETSFVFLHFAHSKLYGLDLSSPRLSRHLAEITFRLLGYLYSQPHLTYMPNNSTDGPPEVPFSADELYVMKIFDDKDQLFTTQWALTIDLYFRAFDSPNAIDIDFKNSFQCHPFIRKFIENFWKEVDCEITKKSIHSDTLKQVLRTFSLIDGILKNLLESDNRHILDCVFYPAALYAQSCRRLLSDHDMLEGTIDALIPALTRSKHIMASRDNHHQPWITADEDEEAHKEVSLFSEEWWKILFSSDQTSSLSLSLGSGQHRSNSHNMKVLTGSQHSTSQLSLTNQSWPNSIHPSTDQVGPLPLRDLQKGNTSVLDENRGAENLV